MIDIQFNDGQFILECILMKYIIKFIWFKECEIDFRIGNKKILNFCYVCGIE